MSNDPPLQINERVHLDRNLYARFDGERVVIEAKFPDGYVDRLHVSALAMAHLFWLSRRICDTMHPAWVIDLSEVPEDDTKEAT